MHPMRLHTLFTSQWHGAEILHAANAFGGMQERGAPQLPAEAIFGLFQHSEHLSAAASLFYECCASSGTSAAAQTDTLEALAIASALIGTPVNTSIVVLVYGAER